MSIQSLRRISLYLLFWAIMIWVLIGNLQSLLPQLQRELNLIVQNPGLCQSQKLQLKYGRFYDLVELIRQTTPETSTILFPNRFETEITIWHDVGHRHLLRSFLYPRGLIRVPSTADWTTCGQQSDEHDVFILVLSREQAGKTYLWPAKRPPEQDIIYASSGWGYARVSPVRSW